MGKSVGALIEYAEKRFVEEQLSFGHGTDNAFDEAVWLVLAAAQISGDELESIWSTELTPIQESAARALIAKRINTRLPAAYLTNEAQFAGLSFYVDERVIVPRSHLGEFIPGRFSPWLRDRGINHILDLCTGSGCIAIALAKVFPDAKVWASDICDDALAVAAINVQRHRLADRVQLVRSDLFKAIPRICFDLIVSNPPYVSTDAMNHLPPEYQAEPPSALEAGEWGLESLRVIFARAHEFLGKEGTLIVEAGSAASAVEHLYPSVPFVWLTGSDGESRVCVLSKAELVQYFAGTDAFQ